MPLKTIMIVEDNAVTADILDRVLSSKGYQVVKAETAEQALRSMRSISPSVFVLDINLPGSNGIVLCHHIRANLRKSIPIIFLTSSTERDVLHACFEAGGDDYILKTAGPEEILKRIQYWAEESINLDLAETRQEKLAKLKEANS